MMLHLSTTQALWPRQPGNLNATPVSCTVSSRCLSYAAHHGQSRKSQTCTYATQGSKITKETDQGPSKIEQRHQEGHGWLQQAQQRWAGLDTAQKGYTVVIGILILLAVPRILTLGVLGLERVLIGGLLAIEEVLLELLVRGGALVSMPARVRALLALEQVQCSTHVAVHTHWQGVFTVCHNARM